MCSIILEMGVSLDKENKWRNNYDNIGTIL